MTSALDFFDLVVSELSCLSKPKADLLRYCSAGDWLRFRDEVCLCYVDNEDILMMFSPSLPLRHFAYHYLRVRLGYVSASLHVSDLEYILAYAHRQREIE